MAITIISRCLTAIALSLAMAAPVLAVDGMAVEAGRDRHRHSEMARIAVQWQWSERWLQTETWHLGGYWDLSAARWHRDDWPGQTTQLTDIGLTPVFRLQANDLRGFYLEGGIGAHWLSSTQLGDKRFGSNFQFGDHLGFGYRFGAMDLSYHLQHMSNADIKYPNDGINFHQLRLQYWLR